jgi:hypothetical protein
MKAVAKAASSFASNDSRVVVVGVISVLELLIGSGAVAD